MEDAKELQASLDKFRLANDDVGGVSGLIRQMRRAKTTKVPGKTNLESPTYKTTKVAQQDLGYDIKSIVRLFPFSF
jgi:hypothetical protein